MKDKQHHEVIILFSIVSFMLLSVMSSFADTTRYEYDDLNRKVTVKSGTPNAPLTYSISGIVTSGGSALAGATVTLGASQTTTDSNGFYGFTGLSNGTYTVTPSKSGYTFSPSSRPVTISGGDALAQNFSGTLAAAYSISGRVTRGGSGLSGVTMTLSGTSSATATTNSSGYYTFTGLTSGSYTVTPSRAGYAFSPTSIGASISGANVTGQNFTATLLAIYSISGQVTSGGSGLSGVTMTLSGTSSATATTNSSGDYTFTSLTNGRYTVRPSKTAYTFSPAQISVAVSGASESGKNFTGTAIPLPSAPSGLSAATISSSQINLSWTDNSNNETGFKIERKTGVGGTYSHIATAGANISTYPNTGLTGGITYYYRVRAYNAGGDSGYSNEANATTACANSMVRIAGATPVYYSSLQAAYNAAVDGNTIQTRTGTLTETVSINRNISVTVEGGYDCAYTTNSGNVTNLKGMLQTFAGGGTLTISNFNLVQ